MPFARLTLSPALPEDRTAALAATLTDLIATDLAKRRDLTSVLIETPQSAVWTIGAARPDVTAHLTVYVTQGTNSPAQKQSFIADAMAALRNTLPAISPTTYNVIKELPAESWGYDGRTQKDRAVTP